jgi:plasmid replication initiation protein
MGVEQLKAIEKSINRREITYDTSNNVVISNDLILHAKSNLTLNEWKLLRLIIMQCRKDDNELYTFTLKAKDFAKLLEVDAHDIRKHLRTMTRHIMREVIDLEDVRSGDWIQFHWTDECKYTSGIVTIKIADRLKPFLLELKGHFTKYKYEEILPFKSMHTLKIYEALIANIDDRNQPHADKYSIVNINMETLRLMTNTTDKYSKYANFRARVLEPAVREMNEKSKYHVTATPYKNNKTIVGIEFMVESQAGYAHRTMSATTDQIDGQMELSDFLQEVKDE